MIIPLLDDRYVDARVESDLRGRDGVTGDPLTRAAKVVGTPDGSPPPFHRIAELHFPSMGALQAAAGSQSAQQVVAHAFSISSGGPPVILVAEEETTIRAISLTMGLVAGSRIGAYEVTAAIGSGGIGEVYRARDTKLKRDVARNVLPDSFTTDPDRLARFQREAEVLAALNHPHIAHIHGLEESDACARSC
jgi:hypothetical protein